MFDHFELSVILRCSRVARCSGVSRCCGRFEVFGGIMVFGYFNPLLECPTAARVLLHVWGYPHHTTFKTHLERNIIVVIEDSNIYTNFFRNYIIFLSYSVPTAETCGARHVVPTHFLILFFLPPPTVSPSHYHATTLLIYAPFSPFTTVGAGSTSAAASRDSWSGHGRARMRGKKGLRS
jgi:hypothetical protein